MKFLEKLSDFVGKYMAFIVVVVAAAALFVPTALIWIKTSWITTLLMIVMFGMGLTLNPVDFAVVFRRPKDVILGCLAQFTIMPLLAFALGKAFALDDALLVGVILVGTCPGGTSSNVITYLSKGDVALSVGMTSVSTLLAPLLTPALTYLLLRQTVSVDMAAMFMSIVKVVILPIAAGFVINKFFSSTTQKAVKVLPLVSVTAIVMIVAAVVSANSAKIMTTGVLVFSVVILHNILGYALGYVIAAFLKVPLAKKKAISIEVGMQNSGLATSLAATSFPSLALATVPGAVFSVWHNISGAILANIYSQMKEK
ncbi:bile acid:sodium symporter family protein [Cloacibacillus porcorum]|uniref:bile acid:sodium symporter family protein n=1 Tax=Cloacibacillus porcorum TaxID=1197717 RepID=UPI001459259B|nr:bile acid:sodium symporter family protein [Cloacibacillus porcorum]MCC8183252.1 bile acid:sodium symporter family protein [Cloacibacillus porcorum]MCI5864309.1 bile acid:sodium symporter family protein [Cloacibacillus porcorum]MDY5389521.1 bile acid:sodium symporter family protein [Cloacibacillus porcorum]NMF18967.1 bile acid:sodium symporter family protein [Cloacibacillus porcorum]